MVCKKCGHKTVKEHGEDICLSCGTKVISVAARKRFIEANLSDILADINKLGTEGTHKKWRIAKSTIWKFKSQAENKPAAPVISPAPEPGKNGLPPLPAFDKSWDTKVQLRWLDVWAGSRKSTK